MRAFLVKMPFFEQEYIKFSEKWEHIEDEYIGVGIVSQILENYGVDVDTSCANSVSEMVLETQSAKPDAVLISVMQTSARLAYEYVLSLRKSGYKGLIFIGGWFAKMAWREIFIHKWPVDFVCYLDAEVTLPEWIRNPKASIIGIATSENWLKQTRYTKLQLRQLYQWPKNYVSPKRISGRKTYSIETSRGCPHSACTFCSQSCGNYVLDKWVPLPIEIVRDEILKLHQLYGATRFATSDDDLLGPIATAQHRANELKALFCSLPFKATFSAAISVKAACNENIIETLQEAGLEKLCIGFESADEAQLKRYNKQQNLEDNFIAAELLVKRDVKMLPGLITFDPYSSKDTVKNNLLFLFNHLHHYDLAKLTKKLHLLTGTAMIKKCANDKLLLGDYLYYDYNFRDPVVGEIFKQLQLYTEKVKEIQKHVIHMDTALQQLAGKIHAEVANNIINGIYSDEFMQNRIQQLVNILNTSNILI